MLNVNDLEIRHRKYKLKSYIPYFVISVGLVLITISALIVYKYSYKSATSHIISKPVNELQNNNSIKTVSKELIDSNETKKEVIEDAAAVRIDNSEEKTLIVEKQKNNLQKIAEKKDKTMLSPSLDFMRKIQASTPLYYENRNENDFQEKEPARLIKEKSVVVDVINKQEQKKEEKPILKTEQISTVNIERKNNDNDIKDVIKRFQVNHNPALSLFVAKRYYQLQEYDKAYNYALITNEINNNIEDSWIIFAQSLVKLNKKEMAIETLQRYIDHSHSSKAKMLQDEILSGKFK